MVVDIYPVFSWQVVTEVLLSETSGTGGRANFNSGIMQAFEALNSSNECYKMVVVITDKDADDQQLSQAIEHQKLLVQVFVLVCTVLRFRQLLGSMVRECIVRLHGYIHVSKVLMQYMMMVWCIRVY